MRRAWSLRPTRYSDTRYVAAHIREIDRLECEAVGLTPKRALVTAFKTSTWSLTACLDGEPVAIFGVVGVDVMQDIGGPWMLCTDKAVLGARVVAIMGPDLIAAMHDSWGRLENYVGAANRRAIRLLEYLGFDIDDETVQVGTLPMRRFSKGGS